MSFPYFANPREFAYMADPAEECHFCSSAGECLSGSHFHGLESIDAICFSCMQAGKLIELDISANSVPASPANEDSEQIFNIIIYCTPKIPTWQDSVWPFKEGLPYKFIKIASKPDYYSKEHFLNSLDGTDEDPEWLWGMLPDREIRNMTEGQYDVSFYLFELDGEKLTTWDAN